MTKATDFQKYLKQQLTNKKFKELYKKCNIQKCMNTNNLKKAKKEAKMLSKTIADKYKPEKIILYGSVARGKVRKYSDIDLCIIKKTNLPFRKRIWKVYEIIRDLDYDYGVEPIVFTPREFAEKKNKKIILLEIL